MAVFLEIRTKHKHSDTVFIIFGCFFLLIREVTTGLLRANLCRRMADNFPDVPSASCEGHAISLFRYIQVLSKRNVDAVYILT